MNQSMFYGRLTKDPELRYTPGGVAVTTFTLAVDRPFKKEGQDRPDADFVDFIAWRQDAETIANYFRKGKPMLIRRARYQVRKSTNNDGRTFYNHEFIVEDFGFSLSDPTQQGSGRAPGDDAAPPSGRGSGAAGGNFSRNQDGSLRDPFQDDGRPIDISDDELPF